MVVVVFDAVVVAVIAMLDVIVIMVVLEFRM